MNVGAGAVVAVARAGTGVETSPCGWVVGLPPVETVVGPGMIALRAGSCAALPAPDEIAVGDFVVTPEKATSAIHISRASAPYGYDSSIFGDTHAHARPVEFLKTVPRAVFPQSVRNTLGSVLTIFRADIALPCIQAQLGLDEQVPQEGDEAVSTVGVWADEIEGQARGQILEAPNDIAHHDFQLFVAGLLHAIGCRAHVEG